jgi:sn-glycerol 3-phosphate transport system substrate-binding protein
MGARTTVAAALMVLAAIVPAWAATTINFWHAMTGANREVIRGLADEFNTSQSEYELVPVYKGTYADTMNAGIAAFRAGNAPEILQVFDAGTATMMAFRGAIKPVHDLMFETGERFDPQAYLPSVVAYYSTVDGDMLSLPFNSSSMVMWINLDALRKAGVPTRPLPATWPEVFAAARRLHATVAPTCGLSTAWITWALIEQFSAWHNLPVATRANGLAGFDAMLTFNGPWQAKLLETLAELQKDRTFDYSGRFADGEKRFLTGECPIFLTSSGFYGEVKTKATFDYAATAMPYFPELKEAPQNAIIGGASLWVMGGRSAAQYRGVARFFSFLSDTSLQARLHRESGYLPITTAALREIRASGFYARVPFLEVPLLELTNKPPTENSRGLRLGNLVQIRDIWAEEIEAALQNRKSAQEALDTAVARGNILLRRFENVGTR